MKNPKILVVGNQLQVLKMFRDAGFPTIVDQGKDDIANADMVVFTGGADVDPRLYNENPLRRTNIDMRRDRSDLSAYEKYLTKPKIGICRGAQFLNVMAGGALWQHVDNHVSEHQAIDLLITRGVVNVTSTHHQMMIPNEKEADILCIAGEARDYFSDNSKREAPPYDTEVVWYNRYQSLCFQPHPEYPNKGPNRNECRQYFFDLLDKIFDIKLEPVMEKIG